MKIRQATHADLDKISQMLFKLITMHKQNLPNDFNEVEQITANTKLEKYIDNQDCVSLVACNDNNEAIGFIIGQIWERKSLILQTRKIGNIMDIAVDDNYQGQGIGQKLYQEFEQRMIALGADEISVEVYDFNKKAMDFYNSCGVNAFLHIQRKSI